MSTRAIIIVVVVGAVVLAIAVFIWQIHKAGQEIDKYREDE